MLLSDCCAGEIVPTKLAWCCRLHMGCESVHCLMFGVTLGGWAGHLEVDPGRGTLGDGCIVRARACPKIVASCFSAQSCWSLMWAKGATGAAFLRASMSLVVARRAALAEETCGIW